MFKLELKIVDYHYLRNTSKEAWAWEFTRRDVAYIATWKRYKNYAQNDQVIDTDEMEEAAKFGLLFFR